MDHLVPVILLLLLLRKSNETQQDEKIEMCFLRNGSTFSCYYQTPNHREKF